jgi:competence protein ComEC
VQELVDKKKIYPVEGKIIVNAGLFPAYEYGDKLQLNCYLKKPDKINDFDYGRYLKGKNFFALCSFADIKVINKNKGNIIKTIALKVRDQLSLSLKKSIKEPQSALLRAMILNETGEIPQEWNDIFSRLSLTHIIAISGSHITIIVSLIMYLAIAFGMFRKKAFWIATGGIIFYIVMIGFPASALRAAIMGIMVIYAQRIGRLSSALNLIIIAAAIMLIFNPFLLLYDAGFQLSFLAVIGLIYVSPILEKVLIKLPDFLNLKEMLIATLSAQAATMPLIIFVFGHFSLLSILANLLILPIIPFLTVFVILNSIIGIFFPFLGNIMGWVSWIFASYWLEVARLISKINFF